MKNIFFVLVNIILISHSYCYELEDYCRFCKKTTVSFVPCEVCSGNGIFCDGKTKPCNQCNDGIMWVDQPLNFTNVETRVVKKESIEKEHCPNCYGRRVSRCIRCRGSRYINRKKTEVKKQYGYTCFICKGDGTKKHFKRCECKTGYVVKCKHCNKTLYTRSFTSNILSDSTTYSSKTIQIGTYYTYSLPSMMILSTYDNDCYYRRDIECVPGYNKVCYVKVLSVIDEYSVLVVGKTLGNIGITKTPIKVTLLNKHSYVDNSEFVSYGFYKCDGTYRYNSSGNSLITTYSFKEITLFENNK